MAKRPFPVVWILHEWWDDEMITKNLAMRNNKGMTVTTVKTGRIRRFSPRTHFHIVTGATLR